MATGKGRVDMRLVDGGRETTSTDGRGNGAGGSRRNAAPPIIMTGRILAPLVLIWVGACGVLDGGSDTTQLGNQPIKCNDYDAARIAAHLKDMPTGFLDEQSFRVGSVDRVKNELTGIPRPYLDELFRLRGVNGFQISERRLGAGVGGQTALNRIGGTPFSVQIAAAPGMVDFATQHEIGHAVEFVVRGKQNDFAGRINSLFNQEGRNAALRSYARTSPTEYFAEAFANYYCSQEAQDFFAKNLPETYKLFQSALEAPPWAEGQGGWDSWVRLSGDTDQPDLEISVPTTVRKIGLCMGTFEDCQKNPKDVGSFALSDLKIKDRTVFKSKDKIAIEKNMVLTIMSYDAQNKPTPVRTVRFKAAG